LQGTSCLCHGTCVPYDGETIESGVVSHFRIADLRSNRSFDCLHPGCVCKELQFNVYELPHCNKTSCRRRNALHPRLGALASIECKPAGRRLVLPAVTVSDRSGGICRLGLSEEHADLPKDEKGVPALRRSPNRAYYGAGITAWVILEYPLSPLGSTAVVA
jgi:hypothetical protein